MKVTYDPRTDTLTVVLKEDTAVAARPQSNWARDILELFRLERRHAPAWHSTFTGGPTEGDGLPDLRAFAAAVVRLI
jgi:hypothetical protein